jgi:hypothetical protein
MLTEDQTPDTEHPADEIDKNFVQDELKETESIEDNDEQIVDL